MPTGIIAKHCARFVLLFFGLLIGGLLVLLPVGLFWPDVFARGGEEPGILSQLLIGLVCLCAVVLATKVAARGIPVSASFVGLSRARFVRHLAGGALVGLSSVLLVVVAADFLGWLEWEPLVRGPATLVALAAGVPTFLALAAAEEIGVRGLPFALVATRSAGFAVLATSLVFALLHVGLPGINLIGMADLLVAGVGLAIARLRTGSLWLPIGWHFGWNFALGQVFGATVSGGESMSEPLFSARFTGPAAWVGGEFGPESGWLAVIVDTLAALLVWWLWPRSTPRPVGYRDGGVNGE